MANTISPPKANDTVVLNTEFFRERYGKCGELHLTYFAGLHGYVYGPAKNDPKKLSVQWNSMHIAYDYFPEELIKIS